MRSKKKVEAYQTFISVVFLPKIASFYKGDFLIVYFDTLPYTKFDLIP